MFCIKNNLKETFLTDTLIMRIRSHKIAVVPLVLTSVKSLFAYATSRLLVYFLMYSQHVID